jgi:hypothetical protein
MLVSGTNNPDLREELDKIIEQYTSDHVGEQIEQIAKLGLKHPHSISLVQEAVSNKPETFRFNCYQYAFDLVAVESVNHIMRKHHSIFPNSEFAQFLVDTRLSELPVEDAEEGDHLLYSAGFRIQHAGKVIGAAIKSKWGLMHVWRHGLYEVPSRYGDSTRFFRRISQEDSIGAFLDYARNRCAVGA